MINKEESKIETMVDNLDLALVGLAGVGLGGAAITFLPAVITNNAPEYFGYQFAASMGALLLSGFGLAIKRYTEYKFIEKRSL